METQVRQSGPYNLVQSEQGFVWMLTGNAGEHWYWHPLLREWTCQPEYSPTVEQAMAGFDPGAPLREGEFHPMMRVGIAADHGGFTLKGHEEKAAAPKGDAR